MQIRHPLPEHEQRANANADADNWTWPPRRQLDPGKVEHQLYGWEKAEQEWQEFTATWWGQSEATIGDILPLGQLSLPVGRFLDSILVRKCYVDMFNYVWALGLHSAADDGIIITGQPGTGKTMFQPYLLIRLLQRKQVVLFTLDGQELFLFYRGKAYTATTHSAPALPEAKEKSFIWSLFDVSEKKGPAGLLIGPQCFPVQTASPDLSRYKVWRKQYTPWMTGFPLWTREELVQGLQLQPRIERLLSELRSFYKGSVSKNKRFWLFPGTHALLEDRFQDQAPPKPQDALEYLLDIAIERFGYAARDVYRGILKFESHTVTALHSGNVGDISLMRLRALASTLASETGIENYEVCDHILALFPVVRGDYWAGVDWEVNFKSAWVAKKFMDSLDVDDDDRDDEDKIHEICQQIFFFLNMPQTIGMAGYFFELLIRRLLAQTAIGDFWAPAAISSDNTDDSELTARSDKPTPIPTDVWCVKSKSPIHRFSDLPQHLESDTYYWAYARDYPLFDAFTVHIKSAESAVLWILLMTMSRVREGPGPGYQKVRDIIRKLKTQMRDETPPGKGEGASAPSVEVRYLLVVPKDGLEGLQCKFPEGWDEDCARDDHRGSTYCLEIPFTAKDLRAECDPRN